MLISQGSLGIFWANPLVATIMTIGVILLLWPVFSIVRDGLLKKAPR